MKKDFFNGRRTFLKKAGKAAIAMGVTNMAVSAIAQKAGHLHTGNQVTGWQQSPLPYAYNALEPVIDATTMEIHYTKHASAYAKNMAEAARDENVATQSTSVENVLSGISKYSVKMRNNAGGHYNHELFWKLLRPAQAGNHPKGTLETAILRDFNSFEAFQKEFTNAATTRFGSGWAWLVKKDNKLVIGSTPNQDNTLMDISEYKGVPILGLDVWEHAYYLKYQNKRADYINGWWSIVNWDYAQQRFEGARS
ncbi:MAG: superoxide dismutase [Agriterribacter sp.]